MLADPRQVEHERLLVGRLDLLLDAVGERVLVDALRRAGEVVVPVGPPLDLVHRLAGQLRAGARDRVVLRRAARVISVS